MIKKWIAAILGVCFCSQVFAAEVIGTSEVEELKQQLGKIQKMEVARILAERKPEGYWFYPPPMGVSFTGQYWLVTQWLGHPIPDFDTKRFMTLVLNQQLSDGSWYYLPDKSVTNNGPLSVTILNYWTLKAMGYPTDSVPMKKARAFIRKSGGLEAANSFTKLLLACFGNLDWDFFPSLPKVPFLSVKTTLDLVTLDLGRWMRAFLPPVAYLANTKTRKLLGENFQIFELLKNPERDPRKNKRVRGVELPDLAMSIYNLHRPYAGSWGGSTTATLLSMMALEHAGTYMPESKRKFQAVIEDSYRYLHLMNIDAEGSAYRGATFDARYWDTVLLGTTLLESGVPKKELEKSAIYVDRFINRHKGGMAFGLDFEPDPDTDDTSEMIIFFRRGGFFPQSIRGALAWLYKMQNEDDQADGTPSAGGWGAYSKDNNGAFPIKQLTEKFKDSTLLFDPATPDVTGHILEAYGALGFKIGHNSSLTIERAVEYLRRSQRPDGTWFGRWGVNSIYGTTFSILGLRAVGVPQADPLIVRGINWIANCQKLKGDGGFGESFLSYSRPNFTCLKAPSTPSQTAWALLALLSAKSANNYRILKALKYLVNTYNPKIGWTDELINGTGHPTVVPIFYPSYAKVFPLQAVSRWLNLNRGF